MCEGANRFMDGTFKVTPRLFRQLFTLHVMMQGKLVPCVYALMLCKQKSAYSEFFDG